MAEHIPSAPQRFPGHEFGGSMSVVYLTDQDRAMLKASFGRSAVYVLAIELPMAPRELSANSMKANRAGSRKKAAYRDGCEMLIRQSLRATLATLDGLGSPAVRLRYGTAPHPVLGKHDGLYRPRDAGNISMPAKRIHDALAKALGIDDSKFVLAGDYIDKSLYGVVLFVAFQGEVSN